MTHDVIHPEGWLPAKGYANGILTRDGTLHIGGRIGWDAEKRFGFDSFIGQMRQALAIGRAILDAAGGTVEDMTRLTWFETDKADYLAAQAAVGQACRAVFGKHFPAMSMVVVAGRIEDEAKVEIEATAHLQQGAARQ
jgi:enamine deaminase RidA (YjgF/YER057c/UK114 family)